jgi:DNA-binding TFAR19-related protein (PDSD5 family)
MLKSYKIFAGNMIVESDNTKELKIQLLNFVKDAAEPQVKNFILNGTIRENIKEDEVKDINEQFEGVWDTNKTHFAK